ncbi:SDR family NAD(P)-dependent oxidoreductase [Paenibacillus glucanolyticus]|uniref:type I polyketide synthase n=2 Tax=Paenibacillus glucanolyticus TaxID=59843 RepID=UPI0037AF2EE7
MQYILEQTKSSNITEQMAYTLLSSLKSLHADKHEDREIAVIGISCTFAGAKDADEYWNNLTKGENCIIPFPAKRNKLIGSTHKSQSSSAPGGYLDEIDQFDEVFFRISPKEASYMDPSQRLVLEKAYEALEDAGYSWESVSGSKTGVYLGMDSTFSSAYYLQTENKDMLALTGTVTGILSGRISYILNLKGPNMVIDTACSSGLIAVHTACRALRNNECSMALAGGVQIGLYPERSDQNDIEAADGKIRAFDKYAGGTVWGEGVGMVLLKPLREALKDRDHIYAVIKGSATNSDGISNGLTAPNTEAQTAVILDSWTDAGIHPQTIAYIETHGTGTVLGDPIELKGITNAFNNYTNQKHFCGIGSVKTNIGHTAGASGIASLIKSVLSMKHSMIPASIHFEEPNPHFDFPNSPIYVNDKLRKWEKGTTPRRSGISSFGFGGANCHIVLEEAPQLEEAEANRTDPDSPKLLILSAKTWGAFKGLVNRYIDFLQKNDGVSLMNLCYMSAIGRGHYEYRAAIICSTVEDLLLKLNQMALVKGEEDITVFPHDINYMKHEVVPGNTKAYLIGQISEQDKARISKLANQKLVDWSGVQDNYAKLIRELSLLYVKGAQINWRELYTGGDYKKIRIPTYPYDRKSHWIQPAESRGEALVEQRVVPIHPLLDRYKELSENIVVFITEFSVDKHWVLSDHMILGKHTVPGTAYLEMVNSIAVRICDEKSYELREVIFYTPLMLERDEVRTVHITITKRKEYYEFTITSNEVSGVLDGKEQITHAVGKICSYPTGMRPVIHIEEIKHKFKEVRTERQTASDISDNFSFGPRWWNDIRMHVGDREALAELRLPDRYEADTLEYRMHPSLLDIAVNILSPNTQQNLYLPLTYKRIQIYGEMPSSIVCLVKERENNNPSKELVSFDITIADSNGKVVVQIEEYTVKRTSKQDVGKNQSEELLYAMSWKQSSIQTIEASIIGKRVLFFKGEGSLSLDLLSLLGSRGAEIIEVTIGDAFVKRGVRNYSINHTPEAYKRLFEEIKAQRIDYVVHTFADRDAGSTMSLDQLAEELDHGILSLLHIVQRMINNRLKDAVKFIIVSPYANEVIGSESFLHPHRAALFNMGKVIALEIQQIQCVSIDLDDHTPVDFVLYEMLREEETLEVVYRNANRYEWELRRADSDNTRMTESITPAVIKTGGVYIITGGTGGIGLELAKQLASIQPVRLILISRTGKEDEQLHEIITAIRSTGSTVEIKNADVSDFQSMSDIIQQIRRQYGQLNGVIHCAGVAAKGMLFRKTEESFRSVISPKILGTWVLDKLTEDDNLDFFIMCSSIASFLADEGQADYTAANAYLDLYAKKRNKTGKNTISISWPAWKEIGMAVNHEKNSESDYFKPISTVKALQAFCSIMNGRNPHVIVGQTNLNVSWKGKATMIGRSLSHTEKVKLHGNSTDQYTRWENAVGEAWAQVLGLNEIDIHHSFYSYGGDSIQAIQIHKELDARFPNRVDITDIFNYPTVKGMAEYLQKSDQPIEQSVKTEDLDDLLDRIEKGELSIDRLG